MSLNIRLKIGTKEYPVLRFHYGFKRKINANGWPLGGMAGGEIILTMESTKDTELLDLMVNHDPECPARHPAKAISGSIEIYDAEEQTVVRSLVFEEAYIYAFDERMDDRATVPMTQTIAISLLRLDIDRTIRLDRRFPQTYAFWWEEYKEDDVVPVFHQTVEEEPIQPECTVSFRLPRNFGFEFGFDWVRTGDAGENAYIRHMLAEQYDRLIHSEYRFFDVKWKQKYDEHRQTSRYIIPWVLLMANQTAKFRLKLEVNKPSGELDVRITGGGADALSVNFNTITADQTGAYFHSQELTVYCNRRFSSEAFIEVWAGDELVGKLAFVPNIKTYPMEIALIPVKLSDTEAQDISTVQLPIVSRLLNQAFVEPRFYTKPLDLSGDMITFGNAERRPAFDYYFRNNRAKEINRRATSRERAPSHLQKKDLHEYLDAAMLSQYPNIASSLAQMYRVYFFPISGGTIQGAGDDWANNAIMFTGYEGKASLTHEILHMLGLHHSFLDGHTTSNDYTYTQYATDNLMDYIHPNLTDDYRWSLWYWQIKRIWNELKIEL